MISLCSLASTPLLLSSNTFKTARSSASCSRFPLSSANTAHSVPRVLTLLTHMPRTLIFALVRVKRPVSGCRYSSDYSDIACVVCMQHQHMLLFWCTSLHAINATTAFLPLKALGTGPMTWLYNCDSNIVSSKTGKTWRGTLWSWLRQRWHC